MIIKMGDEEFYRKQFELYRKLFAENAGHWFGAFITNELVGSLGIFNDNGVARFQHRRGSQRGGS